MTTGGHHHHQSCSPAQEKAAHDAASDGDVDDSTAGSAETRGEKGGRDPVARDSGKWDVSGVEQREGLEGEEEGESGSGPSSGKGSNVASVKEEGRVRSSPDETERDGGQQIAEKDKMGHTRDPAIVEDFRGKTRASGAASVSRGFVRVMKVEEKQSDKDEMVTSPDAIRAVALLLVRHALEDTFGNGAVVVDQAFGEATLVTDGARALLRVAVAPSAHPRTADARQERGTREVKGMEPAWTCEVLDCVKDGKEYGPLRSQVSVLVESLRIAVSRS